MRIGIDYLPAVTHAPGVGRYARELVRALAELPEAREAGLELALACCGPGQRSIGEPALGLEAALIPLTRLERAWPRRALAAWAAVSGGADRWLGGVDLFLRVRHLGPPLSRSVRQLVSVSELPEPGSAQERVFVASLARASEVLVFCQAAVEALHERYGLARERIHPLPVGADHWLRELASLPAPKAQILVLGALRAARQPVRVLRGFEGLLAAGVAAELVFAGGRGDAAAAFELALAKSPARERVRWIAAPREADLPLLVASSSLLVHLAQDEWTAVTPLEALSFGCAVLASPLPAFRESLEHMAAWCAPQDEPQALAGQLAAGCAAGLDQQARAARREWAKSWSWRRNALQTLSLWQRLQALPAPAAPRSGK